MSQPSTNQGTSTAVGGGGKTGPRVYRIVILGDGGVGKSALVMQFVNHRFLDYHDPTIEDAYVKQARIDGEPAKLDILDTAGQLEFNIMRETYMRHGEGFIICYSITDPRSFDEVLNYKKMIDRVRGQEDIPIIVTGNKCDLEHLRKVSTEEGNRLSVQLNAPFFETSAVSRQCVDDVFHELVREIRRKEHDKLVAAEKVLKKQQRRKRVQNFFNRLNVFKHKSRSNGDDAS